MKSVNKVMLIGNVTRDAELKSTQGGQPVCTFGLATNRVWKDQSGQKQTAAEFHSLVCFGGLAEFVGQNVKKGKPLYVEGYLKTRNWEDPSGNKHYRTEIVVENFILLGPRPENGEAPQEEHEGAPEESDHSSSL
jgi:single-strand DNA-binding protein